MSTLKEKAEAILQEKNTKIIPENFSENLEILGIQGDISTYESGSGNLQFTENVVDLPDNNQFIMEIENGSNVLYKEGSNMGLAALKSVVAQTIGLTANKIKKDEVILGVTGTYEGGGSATTVNTTLNLQVGDRSGSFEHLPYMTFENLKSATFDITQLYNWNRSNGNGTPISQTILEMPYVYLKLEITEHHELAGGFEVMYELAALDKPLIYSFNEYDSEAQVAKNCYKASMQSGVFTNTEYNTETSKDELIPGMNYTTFEEFWTAFCSSLYNDSSIRCIKPTKTTTYEVDAMMGYLYSNLV